MAIMSYMLDVVIELENAVQNALNLSSSSSSSSQSSSSRSNSQSHSRHHLIVQDNNTSRNESNSRSSRNGNYRNNTSIYKRRRALRRIDRAVDSLEKLIGKINSRHQNFSVSVSTGRARKGQGEKQRHSRHSRKDGGDRCDGGENDDDNCCILDDRSLASLMKILIHVPQKILEENIRSSSSSQLTSSAGGGVDVSKTKDNALESLYGRVCDSSTYILLRYASMPLDESYVDGLLDRIASLASKKSIHDGLLKVLNTSLAASTSVTRIEKKSHEERSNQHIDNKCHDMDQDRSVDEGGDDVASVHHEEYHSDESVQKQEDMNSHGNEMEMRDLGEILDCNPDEQHDEFVGEEEPMCTLKNNRDKESDDKEGDDESNDMDNGDSSLQPTHDHPEHDVQRMLSLDANETLSLVHLLIPLSLRHMSKHWVFKFMNCNEDMGEFEDGRTSGIDVSHDSGKDKGGSSWNDMQGQMQLRILIGHLLKHFGCLRTDFSREHCKRSNHIGVMTESGEVELEDMLSHIFQTRMDQDHHEEDQHERDERIQDMVEDSLDMVVSFLVENIEYVNDAIENASRYFVEHTDGDVNVDTLMMNRTLTTRNYAKSVNEGIMYYTFKDTIRLSFLVVGTIELFLEDLGVSWESFQSRAEDLLRALGNFVAMYCTDRFLMKANIHESACNAIGLSEKVLFQLYLRISRNDGGDNEASDHYQVEDAPLKRRRLGDTGVDGGRFSRTATIITMLRSFHSSRNDISNSEFGKSILENELVHLGDYFANAFESDDKISPYNDGNVLDEEFADSYSQKSPTVMAHEAMTLVQACTLAELILPCGMKHGHNGDDKDDSKLEVLASLVRPQLDRESMIDSEYSSEATTSHLLDPMNPWNVILARNLSSKLQLEDDEQIRSDEDSIPPEKITTTCSTSSVSDLRSDNASSDYGRSSQSESPPEEDEDGRIMNRDILSKYIEAVAATTNTFE